MITKRILIHMLLAVVLVLPAWAQRTGEGIVVAVTGDVQARMPSGPLHDGRFETHDMFQGASVGEHARIMTGRDGHVCLVLTPGALVHVPPETDVMIKVLRHTADGLPRSEADLVRRIELNLMKGRLYVNGGAPTASLHIHVQTADGVVESNGGLFSVAQDSSKNVWSVHVEAFEVNIVSGNGQRLEISENTYGTFSQNTVVAQKVDLPPEHHTFKLCQPYFRDMEQFKHPTRGYDRQAISRYVGLSGPPIFMGAQGLVADVSPSFRPTTAGTAASVSPAAQRGPDGRRWGEKRIWSWWNEVGVIRGVNYVPRNCVNSTEMWMEETFDANLIEKELGWAKSMGYTSVRIPLQFEVWLHHPEGFMDRFEQFLDIAHSKGLAVVPVLFDDLNRANRAPSAGPQPDPLPGEHNRQWTPSPGAARVTNMQQWPDLEKYTREIMGHHKNDRRILYWDLYHTAGNSDLHEQSLPFMDQTFNWARDINPRQPIAVSVWRELGTPMSARKLERSDIITFQSFENAQLTEAKIRLLQRYDRPIIVTDWLLRQRENTFESILPVYAAYGVGWFNRGLVQGRTQTWIQDRAHQSPDQPDVWQHDVLKPDGTPYNEKEVELIRGFRYLK